MLKTWYLTSSSVGNVKIMIKSFFTASLLTLRTRKTPLGAFLVKNSHFKDGRFSDIFLIVRVQSMLVMDLELKNRQNKT